MTEQSLAALAGHNAEAMSRLEALGEIYRREGVNGLRAAVEQDYLHEHGMPEARDFWATQLVVEAVLTIAERTSTTAVQRRRAWDAFAVDEARTEQTQTEQGGNR